jgi:hypothetical protein
MSYRTSFLSALCAAVLLHLSLSSAFADSGGCPGEEMHRSSNGQYYLHLVPIGACYAPGYRLQWTFGTTDGPVYFRRDGRYPSNVVIADDGERIITAGDYVHDLMGNSHLPDVINDVLNGDLDFDFSRSKAGRILLNAG